MKSLKLLSLALLMILTTLPAALAAAPRRNRADAVHRLQRATEVFSEIMATPDKGIPDELLDKSECISVIPGLKKGALGFGGKYGRGVVMCRKASRQWTAPSFVSIEGGSVGFQIGF